MKKRAYIYCLIIVWALVSVATFWWYQFRFYAPFSETTVVFQVTNLPAPGDGAAGEAIKLVHFWQSGCFCDAPATEHLNEILRAFPQQKFELFVLGSEPPPNGWSEQPYTYLPAQDYPALTAAVPSSPALAIWGIDNQLAYFGPYSVGPICSQETSFVPGVLNSLSQGENIQMTSLVGSGCFCSWSVTNNF